MTFKWYQLNVFGQGSPLPTQCSRGALVTRRLLALCEANRVSANAGRPPTALAPSSSWAVALAKWFRVDRLFYNPGPQTMGLTFPMVGSSFCFCGFPASGLPMYHGPFDQPPNPPKNVQRSSEAQGSMLANAQNHAAFVLHHVYYLRSLFVVASISGDRKLDFTKPFAD